MNLMGTKDTGPKLVRLYTEKQIADAVGLLANQLDRDYQHRFPVLVGILKGSFIFLADLVRQMKTPLRSIEFIRLSSYNSGTVTSGNPIIELELAAETVAGRDVVLVEDIVDTGLSTSAALSYLKRHKPSTVALCTLLDKPSRRQVRVEVGYVGLTVPDQFIVGYGIDFNQKYRQLPEIYTMEE